jgi:hypothetical protein
MKDVMNAHDCTISHKSKQIAFNTISLLLFIDGAAFTNNRHGEYLRLLQIFHRE